MPHHTAQRLARLPRARTRIAPYLARTPLVKLDLGLPDRQKAKVVAEGQAPPRSPQRSRGLT